MSQEPPNSQPPSSPKPKAQQQVTQPQGNSFQAVLKAQTLQFLRGTIRLLEGIVVKLEAAPTTTTTPSWLVQLQGRWSAVLTKIRSFLPENLSAKFSDTALTGIIAGISVILIWTTSTLLSGPSEVATAPSEPEQPSKVVALPSPPEQLPEVVTAPSPEPEQLPEVVTVPSPEPEQLPEVATVPSPEPVPTPGIPTPPELTAPAQPQPVEVIPLSEPTPVVELTPEQTLLAAIEKQVTEISDRFADGLIQSIQVNFEGSSLTLKVDDNWYTLQSSQQDNLAARMLERAKELDFSRLDITDAKGTLVARSPVIGKDMVILRRQMLPNQVAGG